MLFEFQVAWKVRETYSLAQLCIATQAPPPQKEAHKIDSAYVSVMTQVVLQEGMHKICLLGLRP